MFPVRPVPPVPSHQTRPVGLVVMCEHWTLKGDCKERGNKERKVHQKIEIAFKLKWKILHELIGPRKKIISEFPLNLIWVHFTGKSYVFFYKRILCKILQGNPCIFFDFSTISKKTNLEGIFEFLQPDPNLTKI